MPYRNSQIRSGQWWGWWLEALSLKPAFLLLGKCPTLTSGPSRGGFYRHRAPNEPLRVSSGATVMIVPTVPFVETKGLWTRNVKKHTKQGRAFKSKVWELARLKAHMTPSSPKLKVLIFLCLSQHSCFWRELETLPRIQETEVLISALPWTICVVG